VKVAVVKAGVVVIYDVEKARIAAHRYDTLEAERGEDGYWRLEIRYNGSTKSIEGLSDIFIER